MTEASLDGRVNVTFSGILISSILHLSICQKKSGIHMLVKSPPPQKKKINTYINKILKKEKLS